MDLGFALSALPHPERPRERMLRLGPDALSDRELLALVLRSGLRGQNVLDLAQSLLVDTAGLANLFAARPEELARLSGVGVAKAAAVVAAVHLGRRAAVAPQVGRVLRGPSDVASAARPALEGLRRERVVVLVCDGANRLRTNVIVSEGSSDRSPVPIREILNAVLRHDGRAFAIAHNHPSGDTAPSAADVQATGDVANAARIVGLRFLGQVIIAGQAWEPVAAGTALRKPY
jgi:DNA repair protein RadC